MFTVRIPLLVPPTIRIGEEPVTQVAGQLEYGLKYDGYYHVLLVQGFATHDDAEEFLGRAECGIAWLLLTKGIPAEVHLVPQAIRYYDDPETVGANFSKSLGGKLPGPIDAFIQGTECAIYPAEKRIRVATGLPATVKTSVPAEYALNVIVDGASFRTSAQLSQDRKLGVALALYGAYFTENSPKARFLTLIMALETLATATPKSTAAQALLQKWSNELQQFRTQPALSSEDQASLSALERELLFRREDSVRSQVRKLVLSALADSPDAEQQSREAVRLYDLRSTLVHEGTLDAIVVGRSITEAKALVERTLKARFARTVSESTE